MLPHARTVAHHPQQKRNTHKHLPNPPGTRSAAAGAGAEAARHRGAAAAGAVVAATAATETGTEAGTGAGTTAGAATVGRGDERFVCVEVCVC